MQGLETAFGPWASASLRNDRDKKDKKKEEIQRIQGQESKESKERQKERQWLLDISLKFVGQ